MTTPRLLAALPSVSFVAHGVARTGTGDRIRDRNRMVAWFTGEVVTVELGDLRGQALCSGAWCSPSTRATGSTTGVDGVEVAQCEAQMLPLLHQDGV